MISTDELLGRHIVGEELWWEWWKSNIAKYFGQNVVSLKLMLNPAHCRIKHDLLAGAVELVAFDDGDEIATWQL